MTRDEQAQQERDEQDIETAFRMRMQADDLRRASFALEDRIVLRKQLAEMTKKHDDLLMSSIQHGHAMAGNMLKLALKAAEDKK